MEEIFTRIFQVSAQMLLLLLLFNTPFICIFVYVCDVHIPFNVFSCECVYLRLVRCCLAPMHFDVGITYFIARNKFDSVLCVSVCLCVDVVFAPCGVLECVSLACEASR